MSFHEADSDISRLNRAASSCAIPIYPWRRFAEAHAGDGAGGARLFGCIVDHDLVGDRIRVEFSVAQGVQSRRADAVRPFSSRPRTFLPGILLAVCVVMEGWC
jgi:hypothetical protein